MLVIGAKGHAKDLLSVLCLNNQQHNLVFFDDVSDDLPEKLYNIYPILRSLDQATEYFKQDATFAIGLGNPKHRYTLCNKFKKLGGIPSSVISVNATIGQFDVALGQGVNVMSGVVITNSVSIGEGALINAGVSIHHDVHIGQYSEVSPGTVVAGHVIIGEFSSIGAGVTILPKVKIGNNVVVGAGAVVTKDVPDNAVVFGVPARIIKSFE